MPKSPAANKKTPAQNAAASHNKASMAPLGDLKKTTQTAYEETQNDEIEALRSIYMDDYTDLESKTAWSRNTERSFTLRLSASSDNTVTLLLRVTISATYPKTVPTLRLENCSNVGKDCLDHIKSIMNQRPKEMLGEVMIHQIAADIQEVLEDSASIRARQEAVPSLEEERVVREAADAKRAEEDQAALTQRLEEEKIKENLKLQRIYEEARRKKGEAKSKRRIELADEVVEQEMEKITFDNVIAIREDNGSEFSFRSIYLTRRLGEKQATTVFAASPVTSQLSSTLLVVKKACFRNPSAKEPILDLERLLEKLKSVHHPNFINVLAFKLNNKNDDWQCDILTESADQGSLRDLLVLVECLPLHKAKAFGVELLEALDFYHKNGIVHGRLHTGNVLFTILQSEILVLKLADAAFQDMLYHLKVEDRPASRGLLSRSPDWSAPEVNSVSPDKTRRSDIWDFGVVLAEMIFGLGLTRKFPSFSNFINGGGLSGPLESLLSNCSRIDPKKRPNAFDLILSEFLRTDVAAVSLPSSTPRSRRNSSAPAHPIRLRRTSSVRLFTSRYATEWVEAGRLGKGGYGEVVKARNKLDGRVYAIKKITRKTPAELSQVLSEVHLLATLNHPYVVRYYSVWPENDEVAVESPSEANIFLETQDYFASGASQSFNMNQSTGGLDFISSSRFPKIEFGEDDDENESGSGEESSESEASNTDDESQSTSHGRPFLPEPVITTSTLYIQMEFCEKLTLRDMIRKRVDERPDDIWRVFRQVLEGLAYIHKAGIIHRDLKPENIFMDASSHPRIGDFGLATSGQYHAVEDRNPGGIDNLTDGELTRNVGTTLYVAPEMLSATGGRITEKVDMYSFGIILFEMCHPLATGMERSEVLSALRQRHHTLPESFKAPDKAIQGEIILSLISHKPSERPSSSALLMSEKIPVPVEDKTIKVAIDGLADENSPYHHKFMSVLFTNRSNSDIKAQVWDTRKNNVPQAPDGNYTLIHAAVKEKMTMCFKRHGAIKTQHQGLIPLSKYYAGKSVVKLLDSSGTLVQLPYDLTIPHASHLAKQLPVAEKTFTFGTVYRATTLGGAPRISGEADFDIVSERSKDIALQEAEVIKVMDELLDEIPSLASAQLCFHFSHATLLDMILEYSRIPPPRWDAVKEVLGKLNIHHQTWQKIRLELRSASVGVSSTSLDELVKFDFRDTPEQSLTNLHAVFAGTKFLTQVYEVFTHISGVIELCKRFGVRRKIYISPLSTFNDNFYKNGLMFQCIFDTKKRDVLAAGGRYDSLIQAHRPIGVDLSKMPLLHAVGINIAWDTIVSSMVRYQRHAGNAFLKKGEEPEATGHWANRRCDVLVASFDPSILRSTGLKILSSLWANDISAELALDTSSLEELLAHYREDRHSWIVIIRHEGITSGKHDIKLKSVDKKEDFDVRSSELLTVLRSEIRDREAREGTKERAKLIRHPSQPEGPSTEQKLKIHPLTAGHKSKKVDKWRLNEGARAAVQEAIRSLSEGEVVAIETRDEVLEMIRETRLSDADSWKTVIQAVALSERQYIQQLHEFIADLKRNTGETTRNCFVYNFRTGRCICYDMML